jgi:hypothetical protein
LFEVSKLVSALYSGKCGMMDRVSDAFRDFNVGVSFLRLPYGPMDNSYDFENVKCTNMSYSSRHQTACFKVTAKWYNVATQTAESRRVKTAQNSQRSKASNALRVTYSRAVWGIEVLPWP